MKLKTRIEKTFHFQNRSVAVDCVTQSLADPTVISVRFLAQTWMPKDSEESFEVLEVREEPS